MSADTAPETVGAWIAHWAARTPDAPVLLELGREPLTYRALARLCDEFRDALNGTGLGRNDRIVVVHPGGADLAAAIMAIWGSAAVAPLNPDHTATEFETYMTAIRADALVAPAGGAQPARIAAANLGMPVLDLVHVDLHVAGAVALAGGAAGTTRKPGPAQADDLALLLTTSGTTSKAKVVPRSQRKLLARLNMVRVDNELTPDDRSLCTMPLYHGSGLLVSSGSALVSGGSVIIHDAFDIDGFFDAVGRLQPTWFHGVPAFQQELAAKAKSHSQALRQSRLRLIRTGTARLDRAVAESMLAVFNVPVVLAYASSEAGGITTMTLRPGDDSIRYDSVGRPNDPAGHVAIMSEAGELLGPGIDGEIVVRGPQVFDGYDDDPAANADCFVDGWFRTGDQGRFDAEGYLYLTGRIKEMINRGGEKISPDEIDAVLAAHHDVAEVAAFPIPHPTLGEEVAAAIVLRELAVADGWALRRFAQQRLAGFKVPRRFVFVDAIPKGPTGKVARNGLAAAFGLDTRWQMVPAGDGKPGRQPGPLEAQLQEIWARTLGLPEVGLDDDYFLLGGDSLQAVELLLSIEQELGHRLSSAMLFEAGTVAQMAAWIERDRWTGNLVPLQPHGQRPALFCAPGIDGNVFVYHFLAGLLDADQPIWGLRLDGVDDGGVPFRTIEDMAAHYADAVRRQQHGGPYCLAGYSFGGRLVYEMARQFRRAGDEVALLVLFDTYPDVADYQLSVRDRIGFNLQRMQALPGHGLAGYVAAKLAKQSDKVKARLRHKVFALARRWYAARRRPLPRFLFDPAELNLVLGATARLRPYEGSAVLFKAERFAWANPNAHDQWSDLVLGGLDIRPTPGGHYDMLHFPHVQALARDLQDCLDAAQARAPTTADPARTPKPAA